MAQKHSDAAGRYFLLSRFESRDAKSANKKHETTLHERGCNSGLTSALVDFPLGGMHVAIVEECLGRTDLTRSLAG